jgi:hypothetical protein
MTNEIKHEDMEELQGFVDCGFEGIQLAKMAYRVGRISVRFEDLERSALEQAFQFSSPFSAKAATSTPAGVGKVNGSDIDTTTPLPESMIEDERPAACDE